MLLIRIGIVLTALGAGACSACSRDAASNAGDASAGYEAKLPIDAGQTAAGDASTGVERGLHPGVNPFVGPWTMVGAAPTCAMRVAQDPAHSITPLTFAPCASGRAGCQTLVVDWWTNLPGKFPRWTIDFRRGTIARTIGGKPYLLYSRIYPDPNQPIQDFFTAYLSVLQPIDGAPIFATGSFVSDHCSSWTTFGDDGVAFVSGSPPTEMLAWAPWTAPTTFKTKNIQSTTWGSANAQSIVIGGGHLYVELVDSFSVDAFDLATATLLLPNTPQRLNGSSPIPVPHGALVLDGNAPYHADLLRPDATYSALIVPTSPHQLTWAAVDRSAGNTFVWMESDNGGAGYVNPILWTAPYATRLADVVPRKVAVITDATGGGGGNMIVNAGVALTIVAKTQALLTRLSDGMGWMINAEPNDAFVLPVWVDDNELWISTSLAAQKEWRQRQGGIFRLKRSTLGAPAVPRGF